MSESLSIRNALYGIKVLKVFGFASITIENGKSVTKLVDYLLFFLNFIIGFIFAYYSIKYRKELVETSSEIVQVGNFVMYVASIAVSSVSMLVEFLFRHKIWKMILKIEEIDKKFNDIGASFVQQFYVRSERRFKLFIFVIILLAIPVNVTVYVIEKSFLKLALYLYSGTYFILGVGSVVGVMNAIRVRIISISKVLKKILRTSGDIKEVSSTKLSRFNNSELLKALMEIYGKLMETYDSINLCYGVPTMLGFGFLFFYTIFTSFMSFKDLSTDGVLSGISKVSILFSSYLLTFAFSVIFLCTLTENTAKGTLKIINSALRRSTNEMEVALLISFSSLVKRRPPKFTCGLFDFDWTLVYSVII